ncbi:MAG: hypothetical protein KGL37_13605 [Acidobacteriota bacterium]|nr:hypothetical protein [Acidobacteriota bacterium]
MSYLRRLTRETAARFQPRRPRGFAPQNAWRVEEAYVESPQPSGSVNGGSLKPRLESFATSVFTPMRHPLQPQPPAGTTGAQGSHVPEPPKPAFTEMRRELQDAIEELVVFDGGPEERLPQMRQATPNPAPPRELPDPKQAESVLDRVRALVGERARKQPSEGTETCGLPAEAPRDMRLDAPSEKPPSQIAQPVSLHQRDEIPRATPRMIQEPRIAQPARSLYAAGDSFAAKADNAREGAQLSIGSIVVHVEPEAPLQVAPPAARPRPTRMGAVQRQALDGRWMRSYLDRN